MAEIFLASAVGPEGFAKDVVIKVVKSFLANDTQFVQMFIAEARLASKLNHANVVQIFDFGKHGDSYYLAMEYVRGASLWDLRKRCRELKVPFPPTLAAEIGAQVARGLQYAHSLSEGGQKIGVVHRDVTPHNVLLSFDGAVKLTDFGIAKAQTTHTAPGMLKGKFAYMSPEQARGDQVDARTDIFALGIVMWELLTGGRLFDGDSDLAVLRAVQESLIPPPARMNPDVPQELSDVVMKALARPVAERFQSAFEFDRALATFALRSAKSVEDTSVAMFLQQIFKEEYDAPPIGAPVPDTTMPPDDDFGHGHTVARPGRGPTMTATPVGPAPKPQPRRGVMDDDDAPASRTAPARMPLRAEVKTEEFKATSGRPRTEQMPAIKRPVSRRFDPLPVQEPSVIVRPSLTGFSDPTLSATEAASASTPTASASVSSATTPELAPVESSAPIVAPRSNVPLIAALGALVVVLLVAVGFVMTREDPSPPPPAQEPVAAVGQDAGTSEEEEDAGTAPPAEADAGVEAVVDAGLPPAHEPDAGSRSPNRTPPIEPKKGFLKIKAVPFATVNLQGRTYEVMGVKTIQLPAGTYELILKHPKKQAKERVTVPANGTANVDFSAN
ncbi:MAG: serine/threonine protein kinase [Myxococcota bacterium]